MIGGQSFGVLSATVNQEATRRSSTMSATCALNSFPGATQRKLYEAFRQDAAIVLDTLKRRYIS
jgi:hypothetical protein